ncbi:putative signal transducing protein [Winogradskyella aquimaris]|uniref:DUF2007 domain-containing protein n=1 Tax=Winogradskyella aquimaris TaxID=864074 RepID=A0ABU5ENJ3_9FLAO|nr:DUF2007 domain-containing protein [Winogradskyella aquimaris]MDY2586334.1 DUF2007 domain-containing protein [Winogradskyella aquimaris]
MKDTFTTIARYNYSSEAEIIKGRLETEGIKVFLKDNITIDTDPLVSNAIGGIKLNVLAKDAAQARIILDSIPSHTLDNDGNTLVCPNCKSQQISLYSTINSFKSFFHFVIGIIFGTLPFSARYEYKCDSCGTHIDAKY